MSRVYLSLGSNMGHRINNLNEAIRMLSADAADIQQISSVYETEPWGCDNIPFFYNQVIEVTVTSEPFELLNKLHDIEKILGRGPSAGHYTSRPIDLDILFYESRIVTTDSLKIPHPLMHMRRFVLVPLSEIGPDIRHPVLGKTVSQLLACCTDELKVIKIAQ